MSSRLLSAASSCPVQSVHVANRSTNTILLDREFNLAIDPEHEDNDWVLEPAAEAEGKPVLKITVRKAEERQGWSCLFKGDKFRQGYSTYSGVAVQRRGTAWGRWGVRAGRGRGGDGQG